MSHHLRARTEIFGIRAMKDWEFTSGENPRSEMFAYSAFK